MMISTQKDNAEEDAYTFPDSAISFCTRDSQSANRRSNSKLSEMTSLFSPGWKGRSCIEVSEQQKTTL